MQCVCSIDSAQGCYVPWDPHCGWHSCVFQSACTTFAFSSQPRNVLGSKSSRPGAGRTTQSKPYAFPTYKSSFSSLCNICNLRTRATVWQFLGILSQLKIRLAYRAEVPQEAFVLHEVVLASACCIRPDARSNRRAAARAHCIGALNPVRLTTSSAEEEQGRGRGGGRTPLREMLSPNSSC